MKQEKMRRRWMAMLLIFAMVLGNFPVSALGVSENVDASHQKPIKEMLIVNPAPKTTEGAIMVRIHQKPLEDGKYYVNQLDANQKESLTTSQLPPSEGTPYLYYEKGVLTVYGHFKIPKVSGPPILSIESGKLRLAGSGTLEIESDSVCVYFNSPTATLELSEEVDLLVRTYARNGPALSRGRLMSAQGYSGRVSLEARDMIFSNMQEVNLKTTGDIEFCGAKIETETTVGGSPIVNVDGPFVLEGSHVKIKVYEGYKAPYPAPLMICREDVSITATLGDIDISVRGGNAPAIIAEGNVTLSAKGKVNMSSQSSKFPLINFGMRNNQESHFSILQSEEINLMGNIMGGEKTKLKFNAKGKIAIMGGLFMGPDSETKFTSSEGEIHISGEEAKPLIQTGVFNLKAKSNILLTRINDAGMMAPVIMADHIGLQSEKGLVIISGSTGSSVTTSEGETLSANYGGDITTSGLEILEVPTLTTLYTAGGGYVLLSPDAESKGAKLELHNATIESGKNEAIDVLKGIPLVMELFGENKLMALEDKGIGISTNGDLTLNSAVKGSLDIQSIMFSIQSEKSNNAPLKITGNALVTLNSNKAVAVVCKGDFSVEPTVTFEAKGLMAEVMLEGDFSVKNFKGSVCKIKRPLDVDEDEEEGLNPNNEIELTLFGKCDLGMFLTQVPVGASPFGKLTLKIPVGSQLVIGTGLPLRILDMTYLKLEGAIENHGVITLPVGTSSESIKALNLLGSGGVFVPETTEAKDIGKAYTNKGVLLKHTEGDLDLNTNEEVDSNSGKAYSWLKTGTGAEEVWTLTLSNTFFRGNINLPDAPKVIIHVEDDTVVTGSIQAGAYYPCDLYFSGKGLLNLSGGIQNGVGGMITLEKGAQLEMGSALNFGASGGTNSTLNVIGKDTLLSVSSAQGAAIYCDTVNVLDGARINAKAKDVGVKASSGVTISGGATLSSSCTYALYIMGGKLTLDQDSTLLTKGSVAPFCIVDSSSAKIETEVLSLAGLPEGTEIASVKGTDSGYGYRYWSLVKAGGSLQVADENSEPVTLTGAVQGEALTFFKATPPPVVIYQIQVQNDGNGTATANVTSASQGTAITLSAVANKGYKFKNWQVISGGINPIDHRFIMPNSNVVIKAIFEALPVVNPTPTPPPVTPSVPRAPSLPSVPKAMDESESVLGREKEGVLTLHITEALAKEGIKTSLNKDRVLYNVPHSLECHSLVIYIDRAALEVFKEAKVKSVKVGTGFFDLAFDQGVLAEMKALASERIVVSAMKQMQIAPKVKGLVENRPTYDVTFAYEKNGQVESIKTFDKGLVTMGVGYKSSQQEKSKGLYALYVNQNGSIQWLSNSRYASGKVVFARKTPTTISVGYKVSTPSFKDTEKHWGKEDVDFVTGLELIRGLKPAYFEPNMDITRGTFLLALGQLSGADMSIYKETSFKDVDRNDPISPYIEWAVKNNIVQGIGSGEFGLDQPITRQDMAVMMQNYATVIGYKIPVNTPKIQFNDEAQVSSYARDAVVSIQQAGIVKGKSNNRFDPKGNVTRGEASSILRRFVEFVIYEGLK